jgi:hypothetical protein
MTAHIPSWLSYDYAAGRALTDGLDARAHALEQVWGIGRLRLLVSDELREKFDRQQAKLNAALSIGTIDAVRHEVRRMHTAWDTLDRVARENGQKPLVPEVWEVLTPDGELIAVTRTTPEATHYARANRAMTVYSLEEIGRLLAHYSEKLGLIKATWPGATVTAVRDPAMSSKLVDDELPF